MRTRTASTHCSDGRGEKNLSVVLLSVLSLSTHNANTQAVIRKVDMRIMAWVFVMYFSLGLDRFNIGSAVSDNMLGDLKLSTDDYNLGSTLNKVDRCLQISRFEVLTQPNPALLLDCGAALTAHLETHRYVCSCPVHMPSLIFHPRAGPLDSNTGL